MLQGEACVALQGLAPVAGGGADTEVAPHKRLARRRDRLALLLAVGGDERAEGGYSGFSRRIRGRRSRRGGVIDVGGMSLPPPPSFMRRVPAGAVCIPQKWPIGASGGLFAIGTATQSLDSRAMGVFEGLASTRAPPSVTRGEASAVANEPLAVLTSVAKKLLCEGRAVVGWNQREVASVDASYNTLGHARCNK